MWLYYILDSVATLTEIFGLYVVSVHICKTPRYQSPLWKIALVCVLFLTIWASTWLTTLGVYKIFFLAAVDIICLKIFYITTVYQAIVCYELFILLIAFLPEIMVIPCMQWVYGDAMLIEIDGMNLLRWEVYVVTLCIRMLIFIGVYLLVRDWRYHFGGKDVLVISLSFLIALGSNMITIYDYLNLGILSNLILYMVGVFLTMCFLVNVFYSKNTLCIREQELKNQQTIERMNQQFSYYREKAEDEKRMRALYHDMKNHLLILERQNSQETKQMAADLRRQISDYEDYIHTGNDFLDVIIWDKAKKAKEQGIDFLAVADFSSGDFMEPMDISTIFGNALDNALEASVKLPPVRRLITVKAGRMHDMLMIVFENNAVIEKMNGTSKEDKFLHGFGISNICKAVEKYNGECVIRPENGKFVMKIIIPLPEI